MKRADAQKQQSASSPRSRQPFFATDQTVQREPFFNPTGPSTPTPIQAKLTVGAVGDQYEQEADRIASQVVNQINNPSVQQSGDHSSVQREIGEEDDALQMKPIAQTIQRMGEEDESLQMKPATVQRMGEEDDTLQMKPMVSSLRMVDEDEQDLQKKPMPNAVQRADAFSPQATAQGGDVSPDLESSIQQARGSGQPIAETVRTPLEQAFGADFSGVRVHTDAKSDQLNRTIQATAFTNRQDVFFRQGAYEPGSQGGQELLAHELTHVVQQGGASGKGLIQRQLGWTRSRIEEEAGKKRFRSKQYKDIVRMVTDYNENLNSSALQQRESLNNLIDACEIWLNKHIADTSTLLEKRRSAINRLKKDAKKELTNLPKLKEPSNESSIEAKDLPLRETGSQRLSMPLPISELQTAMGEAPAPEGKDVLASGEPKDLEEEENKEATAVGTSEAFPSQSVVQKTDEERLKEMGLTKDEEGWWLSSYNLRSSQIKNLLDERTTISELLTQFEQGSESKSESEEEKGPQQKDKSSAAKASRYQQRGEKLEGQRNYVEAGVEYTRAYELDNLADYALKAALAFQSANDQERAALWSHKVMSSTGASDDLTSIQSHAQAILSSYGLSEKVPYATSAIEKHYTEVRYATLKDEIGKRRQGATTDDIKNEIEAMKASGFAKEQIFSKDVMEVLDARVTEFLARKFNWDTLIDKIDNMATGLDAKKLAVEYIQYKNDPQGTYPLIYTLKQMQVQYLNSSKERQPYKLFNENGKIQQGSVTTTGYDTKDLSTNFAGKGYAIFSMSAYGSIYAAQHKVSQFHHSSFLAGSDAAASGEIKVESGQLKVITNKSGHYQQGAFHLAQALTEFHDTLGQNLGHVTVTYHARKGKTDWNGTAADFVNDAQKYRQQFDMLEKQSKADALIKDKDSKDQTTAESIKGTIEKLKKLPPISDVSSSEQDKSEDKSKQEAPPALPGAYVEEDQIL